MDPTQDPVRNLPLGPDRRYAALDHGERVERRREPRRAADRALLRLAAVVESLEYLADGVILLDAQLGVAHISEAGRRLLETCRDRIAIRNQQLILICPGTASDLRRFGETKAPSDGDCAGGGIVSQLLHRAPAFGAAHRLAVPIASGPA